MSFSTPSRRAVVRTAAWAAPAMAVATTAPAFAASTTTYTTAPEQTYSYDANLTSPATIPLGAFTVRASSEKVPATSATGLPIDAPQFTVVVVVPDSTRNLLASIGATSVEGTAELDYTGAGVLANLTIPPTPVPPSGDMEITAEGTGQASTAGAAGSVTMTLGEIRVQLQAGATPATIVLSTTATNNFHTYTVA